MRWMKGARRRGAALLLLSVMLTTVLAGCGGAPSDTAGAAKGGETDSVAAANRKKETLDLSVMSSTAVYAEVSNMMQKPKAYEGRRVRMKGRFNVLEENKRVYFSCIIQDATACCSQGIEFVLAGKHAYPADYPAKDSEITVEGRFKTYREKGALYCHLVGAKLL